MSLGVYKGRLIASYRLLSGRDTANGHDVEDRSNLGRGVDGESYCTLKHSSSWTVRRSAYRPIATRIMFYAFLLHII
jgi:hypothetical protein